MHRGFTWITLGMAACIVAGGGPTFAQAPSRVIPGARPGAQPIPVAPRILADIPVRLGGVYTTGLGSDARVDLASGSSRKLSAENREWIAANCDVIALSPAEIDPDTFPKIIAAQRLFTPLLYLYASSLHETEHRGSVGVWRPSMQEWALRRGDGREAPFPERGGHWIDFANEDWAHYWAERSNALIRQYGAFGVTVAELPLGNTFAGTDLMHYHTALDRARASLTWLGVVRKEFRNLLIPSAIGFDLAAGHSTSDPGTSFTAPALIPRLWNDFYPLTDGAWCEGWIQPYWDRLPQSETLWETQMEAADRAGRIGQVFIAGAAYRNDRELEFALASYLLIVHNQGRVVFQPMPIVPGEAPDSGFSLATLQREVLKRPAFFRIQLGRGMQERHQIPAAGGLVWRRNFQFGDVYVNSDESKTVDVRFAGLLRRVTGELVSRVVLPPHTGAILLYTTSVSRKRDHSGVTKRSHHRKVRQQ